MNHFSKTCTQFRDGVKYVKDESHQLSSNDSLYHLELVSNVSPDSKQWFINLLIRLNDCPQCEVKCQLDGGFTCNAMGYAQYCKLARSNAPKLENSREVARVRWFNNLTVMMVQSAIATIAFSADLFKARSC